jgi:polyhydroxyalkanoate synthesis regulator phasin
MSGVLISTNKDKSDTKETDMSRMIKVGMVGLLVVGALTVVMAGSALAQEPDPLDKPFGGFGGRGFGRFGGERWAMFDTMAEALGLTPEGLFAELHAGKSLAELAEAQGVDTQTLGNAMEAARVEAIQQAVEDGKLTQEQADRILERLENRPTQEELVEAKKQAIQQALEDGTISQEQADWMLEGLENGYWGGRGFRGHGFGKPGGFRGMGGFHGPRDAGSQGVSGISL